MQGFSRTLFITLGVLSEYPLHHSPKPRRIEQPERLRRMWWLARAPTNEDRRIYKDTAMYQIAAEPPPPTSNDDEPEDTDLIIEILQSLRSYSPQTSRSY